MIQNPSFNILWSLNKVGNTYRGILVHLSMQDFLLNSDHRFSVEIKFRVWFGHSRTLIFFQFIYLFLYLEAFWKHQGFGQVWISQQRQTGLKLKFTGTEVDVIKLHKISWTTSHKTTSNINDIQYLHILQWVYIGILHSGSPLFDRHK